MATSIQGVQNLGASQTNLLLLGLAFYLLGVKLPTARFNIPLNNQLQNMDLMKMEESELAVFRSKFETKWNFWNRFRVLNSILPVKALLFLIFLM